MYTYGKDYIMGLMKKQGEVSPVPDGKLHREPEDKIIAGSIDRNQLQVDAPRPKSNTVDSAVFKMADEKDY